MTPVRHSRPTVLHALVAVVTLVSGFVLTVQIKTERSIETSLQVSSGRLGEVAYRYRAEEQRQVVLRQRIADLRREITAEEQRAAGSREATAALASELNDLRTRAGLVPMHGPGIVVTIADSRRPLRPGEDPNLVLIHYSDVRAVVGLLWAAGAEAVAVNDERVTGTTGLSCVGTTILCNARRLAPPYRIVAIGEPQRLLAAVRSRNGAVEQLRAFEFPVTVTAATDLRVSEYAGGFGHRYARPVEPQ